MKDGGFNLGKSGVCYLELSKACGSYLSRAVLRTEVYIIVQHIHTIFGT